MDHKNQEQLLREIHPRPWNWIWIGEGPSGGHLYLTDANGRKIAALWGKAEEKAASAELIIRLVNGAGLL